MDVQSLGFLATEKSFLKLLYPRFFKTAIFDQGIIAIKHCSWLSVNSRHSNYLHNSMLMSIQPMSPTRQVVK